MAWEINQREWSLMTSRLDECSRNLKGINTRIGKYLDDISKPSFHVKPTMMDTEKLEKLCPSVGVDHESDLICEYCFTDCEKGEAGYHSCDHVLLCPACAPCDECNEKEKAT